MAGCTWELGRKQDPRSSVAGGVRAEAVSQQGNGAQGQSFGDAHGCGEADHTGSDHRDPDTFLHPAGGREPTGRSVSTCCNTTCDNRPSYELTIDPTTQSKNRLHNRWLSKSKFLQALTYFCMIRSPIPIYFKRLI